MRSVLVEIKLTVMTCPVCGIVYGLNESFRSELSEHHGGHNNKGGWYCPMGHTLYYPDQTPEEQLRAKALRLESQLEFERNRRYNAEATAKRERTRRKNVETRVKHGVCPDCNRHFVNVERHMKMKHGAT